MPEEMTLPFQEPIRPPKKLPKEKVTKPASPPTQLVTPVIYRGGKSSIASWVIGSFPPHKHFVDVFGGGAAISLAKSPSETDVYNDIGNVSRFFWALREYGDELYDFLYYSPWSRDFFKWARDNRDKYLAISESEWARDKYHSDRVKYYIIRWAACWYITILQSFRHEEDDDSWLVSKGVNVASSYASHVDDFPKVIDRLRRTIIENKDCLDLVEMYDNKDTLFYCDPPYLPETWEADKGGYRNIMTREEHVSFLNKMTSVSGQVVISGYPSPLYEEKLTGWKRIAKVRMGAIKNSQQEATERTEVLWIKEHQSGLWSQET